MQTIAPPSFFGISTKTVSFLVGVITLSTIMLILSLGQEQSFGFLLEPSSHMDMIQTTLSSGGQVQFKLKFLVEPSQHRLDTHFGFETGLVALVTGLDELIGLELDVLF